MAAVASPQIRVPKTHRRARLVAALAVAALGFAGVQSWLDHRTAPAPHVFGAADPSPNVVGPAKVNEQFHLGYWLSRPNLEIENVTPNIGANSASAAIAVTVCRDVKEAFGAAPGNLQKACGSLVPARDVRLGPNDLVVVTVVPMRPGRIDVRGVRVDLRSGSRRWHEDGVGTSARLTAH